MCIVCWLMMFSSQFRGHTCRNPDFFSRTVYGHFVVITHSSYQCTNLNTIIYMALYSIASCGNMHKIIKRTDCSSYCKPIELSKNS